MVEEQESDRIICIDERTYVCVFRIPGRCQPLLNSDGLRYSAPPMSHDPSAQPHSYTIDLVIRPRLRDLGAFSVRRSLPAAERRLVGPFAFFDHMGPAVLEPGHPMTVRPHPHIGLATVTYLFEGEILHRDSLGSVQVIRPGEVNWMVAGRGIVHSERGTEAQREKGGPIHGIQLWLALPTALEETDPKFVHHPAEALPSLSLPGVYLKVVLGNAFGMTSPVEVLSPMHYVEACLERNAELVVPDEHEERAAYVVEGSITVDDETIEAGAMVVFRPRVKATIQSVEPARVMLLGGERLDGERHIFWNFVSSSKERIDQAKGDWREGRFAKVPGDEVEFIPLPE
jgi:redox-sensitive bicupin YhaK (pirin superfamily)